MKVRTMCRLCLKSDLLIYMFDNRLKTQEQLRACLLLCTGVDIKETDQVSKFVCNNCCTIAVKLFKFRRNALANDKALKEYVGQNFVEPLKNKDDIVKFNNSLAKDIEEADKDTTNVILDVPRCIPQETGNAVHFSIIRLFKRLPKIIIPNDLLRLDIDPVVVLDKDAILQKTNDVQSSNETPESLEDIDLFRKKLPGINIVRIQSLSVNSIDEIKEQDLPSPSTSAGTKRHRTISEDSPEVIPKKKKRIYSKQSKLLQKIELPEKSPKDVESKKKIFTSSLELTTSLEKTCSSEVSPPEEIKNNSTPSEDENSFLEPLNNLTVEVCKTCSKMFLSKKQCRIHETQVHSKCTVCRIKHKKQTNTYRYLRETCRKYIELNQPRLCLVRADDIPEIVVKYADVLSQEYDYDIFDDVPDESAYLSSVFQRHTRLRFSRESKCSQSFDPSNVTTYINQNSLTLPVMFSDLLVYKVPVFLNIAQKMSATVSFSKQKLNNNKITWDTSQAIDLIDKEAGSSQGQNSNRTTFRSYLSKRIDNLIDFNDKMLLKTKVKNRIDVTSEIMDKLVMHNSSPQKVADENSVQILNINAVNSMIVTQPILAINNNSVITNACLDTKVQSSKPIENKGKCILRVKAPWELNHCT